MVHKKTIFSLLLFIAGFTITSAQSRAASEAELIKMGIAFFSEGKYTEAAGILQLAGPVPEALYWLSLSELSAGNYNKALSHLDTLEKAGSGSRWSADVLYHRARCYYYLGRHEEALDNLNKYSRGLNDSDLRKATAYYWQGESLFSMELFDNAADAFSMVMEKYPHSTKYEASYYRLNLINQKKAEAELLSILKWSHEESLRSLDEYQKREKIYEEAIAAYQQQIEKILAGNEAIESTATESVYQDRLIAANRHIAALEASLAEANAGLIELEDTGILNSKPLGLDEKLKKIQELKAAALELSNTLAKMINEGKQ